MGLQAVLAIRRAYSGVGLLLLSTRLETRLLVELMRERPSGVGHLLKDRVAGIQEFVGALREIAAGRSVVDAALIAARRQPVTLLSSREPVILPAISAAIVDSAPMCDSGAVVVLIGNLPSTEPRFRR